MKLFHLLASLILALIVSTGYGTTAAAADNSASESDQLKIAALEGLMSASPERALPIIKKVLTSNNSQAVKTRALFVLGQIENPESQSLLLGVAAKNGPLQLEAVRQIGIGGVKTSMQQLGQIYTDGNHSVRKSVLQAFLIADDAESVFQIASNATTDQEFDDAVQTLGAMDATDQLRRLLDKGSERESLIQAYAIAGDLQSLQQLAASSTNPKQQEAAIRNIGIVGGREAGEALMQIYRNSNEAHIREAVLQGLLIADHDKGVMELFRASQDADEKRKLLRTLVNMDSDLAFDVIDSALEGN